MKRDIRTMPKGLIAPLTQAALASLRALAEGTAPRCRKSIAHAWFTSL